MNILKKQKTLDFNLSELNNILKYKRFFSQKNLATINFHKNIINKDNILLSNINTKFSELFSNSNIDIFYSLNLQNNTGSADIDILIVVDNHVVVVKMFSYFNNITINNDHISVKLMDNVFKIIENPVLTNQRNIDFLKKHLIESEININNLVFHNIVLINTNTDIKSDNPILEIYRPNIFVSYINNLVHNMSNNNPNKDIILKKIIEINKRLPYIDNDFYMVKREAGEKKIKYITAGSILSLIVLPILFAFVMHKTMDDVYENSEKSFEMKNLSDNKAIIKDKDKIIKELPGEYLICDHLGIKNINNSAKVRVWQCTTDKSNFTLYQKDGLDVLNINGRDVELKNKGYYSKVPDYTVNNLTKGTFDITIKKGKTIKVFTKKIENAARLSSYTLCKYEYKKQKWECYKDGYIWAKKPMITFAGPLYFVDTDGSQKQFTFSY
jgi:hypothetical protein